MEATLKDNGIRTFVKLLQCASKFGDDLHICVGPTCWEMSSIDPSKTAYVKYTLEKDFFQYWRRKSNVKGEIKCRVFVKSILAILGKPAQMASVQKIELKIVDPSAELRPRSRINKRRRREAQEVPADRDFIKKEGNEDEDTDTDENEAQAGLQAKLVIRLCCEHGVIRKHSLHLATSAFDRVNVDPETTPSHFTISSRILREWLEHFTISFPSSRDPLNPTGGLSQLCWLFAEDHVRIKSLEGGGGAGLSTEIKVDTQEFEDFELFGDRVDMRMPMKEFKAVLSLAEQLSITLNVSFSTADQPLTLTNLEDELEDLTIFCAVATSKEEEAFAGVHLAHEIEPPRAASREQSMNRGTARSAQVEVGGPAGSGASSARRKGAGTQRRPKLSLSASKPVEKEEERLVTVYLPSRAAASQSHSQVNPRASASPQKSRSNDQEPLFLPLSQDRSPPPDAGPSNTQFGGVRMTQQEVLDYAGLGDIDMDELGDMMNDEEEEEEAGASQIPAPSAHRQQPVTSPRAPMGSQARFKAREKERQERITQRETLGRVGPSRSLEQENVVDTTEANENDFTWDPTIDMDPNLMGELDAPAERPFASTSKDARRQALSDVEMEEERKPEISDNDGEVVDDWDDDGDDDEGALGPTQYDINSKYRPLFD
ncbi:hypothetical protein L198_02945 [Cryptococcus wingfieldii CBS 7118]|uniref:Cell cycle checkpoint control protein RAD9A n=1 Tax=Cryptococcus wingfieldii CBS 7118 TaxID=1295528 RepID=A0A1E3JIG5_9TREE|nr:hypothetical protein L198_02945 [Cryptococcus wingfieldii CBS 7118]ODO00625.1 hypothetical protein L198_02945 [Cryptococcus wingfieldii CBS 7118]